MSPSSNQMAMRNQVLASIDPIMYELHKIPSKGIVGTIGQANVWGGGDWGREYSTNVETIIVIAKGMAIKYVQSFDIAAENSSAESEKPVTLHIALVSLSLALLYVALPPKLLRISTDDSFRRPRDLAKTSASGSVATGDHDLKLDLIGDISPSDIKETLGLILNRMTPALTKVNTCSVPRDIVLANTSKSNRHAIRAIRMPVIIVPAVGTPVLGSSFEYIWKNKPS